MKKTRKVAISLFLTVVMVCGSFISAFAADSGTLYAARDAVCEELGNMDAQFGKGESDTTIGVMGLGPADNGDGTFSDAKISFTVTVDTAGVYEISLRYAAKVKEGGDRRADIIINGVRSDLAIEETVDWQTCNVLTLDAHLNTGDNSIVFVNDEEFNDDTVKAINIDYIAYELKTADEVDNGAADDGAVDDGAADDGAVDDGAADDGAADDGAVDDGAADDSTEADDSATTGTSSVTTGDISDVLPLMLIACACAFAVVFSKKTAKN